MYLLAEIDATCFIDVMLVIDTFEMLVKEILNHCSYLGFSKSEIMISGSVVVAVVAAAFVH